MTPLRTKRLKQNGRCSHFLSKTPQSVFHHTVFAPVSSLFPAPRPPPSVIPYGPFCPLIYISAPSQTGVSAVLIIQAHDAATPRQDRYPLGYLHKLQKGQASCLRVPWEKGRNDNDLLINVTFNTAWNKGVYLGVDKTVSNQT